MNKEEKHDFHAHNRMTEGNPPTYGMDDLGDIMVREESQVQKDKYCVISLIHSI
jgi:hypothetical protein